MSQKNKIIDGTSYTYDDVNIVPLYTNIKSRRDIIIKTKLTKNYSINIPIIASPMDTVTGEKMMFEMWRLGGIGILHRFIPIDEQINIITNLKKRISQYKIKEYLPQDTLIGVSIGVKEVDIENAKRLLENGANIILIDIAHGHCEMMKNTLSKLNELKNDYKFDIIAGNVATPEATKDLIEWGADAVRVGIGGGCFTPDMRVNTETGLIPIKDIKIGDMVYTHLGRLKKVIGKISYPINDNIMVINNKIMCTKNHEFYVLPKYIISKDNSYKTTIHKDNIHKYAKWVDASSLTVDFRLIDLTTMKSMPITSIEKIEYNGIVYDLSVEEDKSYNIENIIVHNSVCTTRKKSGSGVPMITSILECASVAEEFDIPIIADGGIRYEGDVAKAIGAGADTVMLGSLLAGTDESPGDLIDVSYEINSGKVKVYRGSASRECKMKSGNTSNVEGVSRYINYKGSVESVISAIIDGLRSAMSYSGSCNINEMKEKCVFRQVTNSGVIEASPHLK